MNDKNVSFVTDTATMCVFDVAGLRHRLKDDADWWTTPDTELAEVNNGTVAFVGLSDDGRYLVSIEDDIKSADVEVSLRVPSGRVFIGAGEEVTSAGLEPECIRGGVFIELAPGNYKLRIKKAGASLSLEFVAGGEGANRFDVPVRL